MILVVDNYDSFVYNLVQYVGDALADAGRDPREELRVERNDALTLADVRDIDPDGIVVSPGPGTPADAGVSTAVFSLDYPTLGVCLGHQALVAANGGRVGHAPSVVHGKPSTIAHDGRGVFAGLPDMLSVGRYHSLAATGDLPRALEATAHTTDDRDLVMAVRHREKPHVGVQFHPESILTDGGKQLIRTFLQTCYTA
ncbi:anthranilate synthase component II [Salarchaeum japonicum]|uniref:anthranilate synthase n=1 Tax=Salarchaeum japonicum TaxID=555573 RepID=A0AAV3T207_9EURY|nr:aminodeoxychorismate/anthranilate synthase component II [Salarchaeum japonicum]